MKASVAARKIRAVVENHVATYSMMPSGLFSIWRKGESHDLTIEDLDRISDAPKGHRPMIIAKTLDEWMLKKSCEGAVVVGYIGNCYPYRS